MGGKMTRKIGLARTEAWWGLKNLTFNFLRYLQRTFSLAAAGLYLSKASQSLLAAPIRQLCSCAFRTASVGGFLTPFDTYWCSIFRGALNNKPLKSSFASRFFSSAVLFAAAMVAYKADLASSACE
jgi:hypothetical protein